MAVSAEKIQEMALLIKPFGLTTRHHMTVTQERESPSLQRAMREITDRCRNAKKQERRFVAQLLSIEHTPYANGVKDCWKLEFQVDLEE